MQLIQAVVDWIVIFVAERVFDWVMGGVILAIVLFLKPQLNFKWAKIVFRIRGMRARFLFNVVMNYHYHKGIDVPAMNDLKPRLERLDAFEDLEYIQSDRGDTLRIQMRLDGNVDEYIIGEIWDIDDDVLTGISVLQKKTLDYKEIGDFVDLSIAARERLFTALNDAGIRPLELPQIAVSISWDTKKFSIIPWLNKDYRFIGAIKVENTDIVISQSEKESIVTSHAGTPLFKEILRNLIVDNYGK